LENLLDQASKAYYSGVPLMSDASFDILSAHFNYSSVGHKVTGGLPHYFPMYSLLKIFDMDNAPLTIEDCIETPKLDGAAISLLYVEGEFTLALTRGDGKIGQDITKNVAHLVPSSIDTLDITQIDGEVLAPKNIPNSRNYAAGALNLKDVEEVKKRDLRFVAYSCRPTQITFWSIDMKNLERQGFNTVLSFDTTDFPTDGKVFRIDNYAKWKMLGYTSKHPRGSFAFKIQQASIETTLLDVQWQVGKSGVVSPVAILEPVMVGDAKVSRATLHNISYIRDLDLEIGCRVGIIRSGEIIPRVVERLN